MGGNQYKPKWTFEESEKLLLEAVEISNDPDMDFIGEVARRQDVYHNVYGYIVEKHPKLEKHLKQLKSNCETNCFYNGKNGNINVAMAIMNLKSNHGWTDRNTQDVNIKSEQPLFKLDD